MRKKIVCLALFLAVLFIFGSQLPVAARPAAEDKNASTRESWVGIAVYHPFQYPHGSFSVRGLRVNAIYGANDDLSGIDAGVINELRDDLNGLQVGLENRVEGTASGLQIGLRNRAGSDVEGVQLGLANYSSGYQRGVQLGIYNQADHISGLQLGFWNEARTLHGVQLGLVNFKEDPGSGMPRSFPVTAFLGVNWTF